MNATLDSSSHQTALSVWVSLYASLLTLLAACLPAYLPVCLCVSGSVSVCQDGVYKPQLFEGKEELKRTQTDIHLLTNLTIGPNQLTQTGTDFQ